VWADAGTIEGHLDAFEDDLQPGCGSFASVTNVGTTQEVSEPVPIDTEGIGDRAIGWTATLTVSGQIAETGSVVVVVGEQATLVQEVGREVDGDQLAAVARMVAERAEG
jgi:hypothetical protein